MMEYKSKCHSNIPLYGKHTSKELIKKTNMHPCYNRDAIDYARIHLPIAPKCNIQCNYCNRKYDCQNESRPGVTSVILTPEEALEHYKASKEKHPKLTVVGIAGPGDAMANYEETRKTLMLIREYDQEAIFCLSTNGLELAPHIDELIELGVTHITVTINTIYEDVAADIYKYITVNGKKITGLKAAKILLQRQFEAIEILASKDVMVKVNIVYIKNVNDHHIESVVRKVSMLGATMTNILPLIPTQGTPFEFIEKPSSSELLLTRKKCEKYIKQMYHCKQCRADAVGTLCNKKNKRLEAN